MHVLSICRPPPSSCEASHDVCHGSVMEVSSWKTLCFRQRTKDLTHYLHMGCITVKALNYWQSKMSLTALFVFSNSSLWCFCFTNNSQVSITAGTFPALLLAWGILKTLTYFRNVWAHKHPESPYNALQHGFEPAVRSHATHSFMIYIVKCDYLESIPSNLNPQCLFQQIKRMYSIKKDQNLHFYEQLLIFSTSLQLEFHSWSNPPPWMPL